MAEYATGINGDIGSYVARHNDRNFEVGRVKSKIVDQCLGKPFHSEFRGTIGGVRDISTERSPKAIHATGVYNMSFST